MELSQSAEDYLEAMFILERSGPVKVSDIASHLGISMPSVTGAMKKLAARGLITYERYGPVTLSQRGRAIGRKTYEKHKLLARFFTSLGVDEKTALHDACLAEHVLSNRTIRKLRAFVGNKE